MDLVPVSNNHERAQDQGGTPLYKGRVGVLGLFGLESGTVFRGNYGSVHEWTYISFQFQMNKNEIEMREFEMHLENFLVSALTW